MRAPRMCALVVACALAPAARPAAADPPRPWHASAFAGGYLALTGAADYGGQATVTVSPGGAWGRFGLRASARSLEDREAVFLAGLAFEAAASRPRLALGLFGELGAGTDQIPLVGGGVQTTLWAIGPLALGGEAAAHLYIDGLDSSLALTGVLMLGLAR